MSNEILKHHLLSAGPLLDEEGNISEAGYAFKLIKKYDRNKIAAPKLRIKEWDYYYLGNQEVGIALTVADNSYMTLVGASIFDFKKKTHHTKNIIKLLTRKRVLMPSSSARGDIIYNDKNFSFTFKHENNKRHLVVEMKNFLDDKMLRADLYLEETLDDSMVIVTPFKKPKYFYYNQNINFLKVNGYAKLGETTYDFDKDAYDVLDWGRGVCTYRPTWNRASLSGEYEGKKLGFNLGYGFGDTSKASENTFFYDGKAYKLDDVKFDIPIAKNGKDDFLKPWTFRSKNKDIDLIFEPLFNRANATNALVIKSIQDQVFGTFKGTITIEGKKIYFENLIGFAEKVTNWW